MLSFSACTKSDDNVHNTPIKFIGETLEDHPIVFITEPSLNDISWHFGDGDSAVSTQSIPVHTYSKGGNHSVSVSGTKGRQKYSGQLFIYITDSVTFIAKKYGKDISRLRNWHHTVFSEPANPGIPPTYGTANDTSFAYKMENDSTLFANAVLSKMDNNVVYFTKVNNIPYSFSLSYNVITGSISFTQAINALGGSSGNTYTSF